MKKKVISMLALGSIILTACSSSSAGFSFDEGYQTFHYKEKSMPLANRKLPKIVFKEQKFSLWNGLLSKKKGQ